MNVLNNIKVAYKILILVIIAAIGMIGIGYQGYTTIQTSKQSLSIIYQQNMQQLYHIGEAKYMLRDMQSRAALAMAAHDAARFAELKKDASEIQSKFDQNWNGYSKAVAGTDAAKANDEIQQNWKTFYDAMNHVIDLASSGNMAEAETYYSKTGAQATTNLRKVLEAQQDAAQQNSESLYQQIESASSSASTIMALFCIIALVILFIGALWISKAITTPLQAMVAACQRLGAGDFRLTPRQVNRGDEFGHMADVIITMRDSLNELMRKTHDSTQQIAAASEELTASSQQSAQASNQVAQSVTDAASAVIQQQDAVESSTTAVQQISTTVGSINDQAKRVARRAESAAQCAADGAQVIDTTVDQIHNGAKSVQESSQMVDRLGESSQEIGTIVETISSIADQTNLLALNAAIEAARAGEHGRGFAVVADEVRKLAEQSGQAAQQITTLISSVQSDTHSAVEAMKTGRATVDTGAQSVEKLREAFLQIDKLVKDVSQEVEQMTSAVHSASTDTDNISTHVANIGEQGKSVSAEMETVSAATEEQSASASEIASASESLSKLAEQLQASLSQFRF